MEQFLGDLVHAMLWALIVTFGFAAIGVWATIEWILRMMNRSEAAVREGEERVAATLHRGNDGGPEA